MLYMQDNILNLKYTLLFGGGAIRGVAYCGAYKALEELNVTYETIAGSSVGAVFAGLVAVGYNAEETCKIMQKVNYELFKDIQFGIGTQFALCKGEVFLEWLRELIERKYYGSSYVKGKNKSVTFEDLDKNLVIITTDLSNFECKEFSKFATPDFEIAKAIRISSGMPGLMKPYEYNNTLLVDGDLQKSAPMWSLSKNLLPENNRIIEFRLEGNFQGNDHNIVEYVNAIYSYATSTGTKFLKNLYGQKDNYDYIVLDTGDLNIVDFNISLERRNALIEQGYTQTINYFKQTLKNKKQHLLSLYKKIDKTFELIGKNLEREKVQEAKNSLGDLYIELCNHIENINIDDKQELIKFKNIFMENIRTSLLFGQIKLNNLALVMAQFRLCKNKIKERISEYNKYLDTI